jgi:hypothetical protein
MLKWRYSDANTADTTSPSGGKQRTFNVGA